MQHSRDLQILDKAVLAGKLPRDIYPGDGFADYLVFLGELQGSIAGNLTVEALPAHQHGIRDLPVRAVVHHYGAIVHDQFIN